MGSTKDDQSLVIAIETPHSSHLNISYERRPQTFDRIHDNQIDSDSAQGLYHLEIDAETGRTGLKDEKITIY